jgi:hypothetical protein
MASATTPKGIAGPKMLSCKYTGRKAYAYRNGGMFDLRPLRMFYQVARWKGKDVTPFTRIVDPELIAHLQAIKTRLYPTS